MIENKERILKHIFTRKTIRSFIDEKEIPFYGMAKEFFIKENKTNKEIIEYFYNILKTKYRNEYFYKNTLLNSLLTKNNTAITELPIYKSKADFILIDRDIIIYEIKTELDNLSRLKSQIEDYYKISKKVVVLSYEENIENIKKEVPKSVGIDILKDDKIINIRKPVEYTEKLDKEIMFKVLRKYEFQNVIKEHYDFLPKVSDFEYYSECLRLFKDIPLNISYNLFVEQLKNRGNEESLDSIPYELKFLIYFMKLSEEEKEKLIVFLNKA